MKKLLAIILTLAMVLSVLAIEVAFATTEPTVTVETVEAEAGDTVEVKVLISNNPGIWGLKIQIDYDESVLTLTSAENGDFFANSEWTKGKLDKIPYTLSYGANDFADITTVSGTLAILTFSVSDTAEAGTYDITVDYEAGNIINSDLDDVNFAMVNGKVTIPAPTPEVTAEPTATPTPEPTVTPTPTPHPALKYLYYKISNDEVIIKDCDVNATGVLEIPGTIEGYPVTSIDYGALGSRRGITSIIIPDSVTSIGGRAFQNCTGLTNIVIPASVTSIGGIAFYGCDSLRTVYYMGTEEQWNNIAIGSDNSALIDANRVYIYGTIIGATVDIGSSLTINYFAEAPENAIMKFTSSSGRVTEVNGVLDAKIGYYKFEYTGINPQCMNDTIKAELVVGGEVLDVKENYSIKAYCDNMANGHTNLNLSPSQYEALKTLLADMLTYGSASQEYTKYNTSNLADTSDWVSEYKSAFVVPTGVKKVTGNADANNKVKSVGLNMANVNKVYFKMILTDDVAIKLNGAVVDKASLVANDDGSFTLYTAGIFATQFNNVYTLELIKNGETISTVQYNVNAYIQAKYNTSGLEDIVKALSNYGTSAVNYQRSLVEDDFNLEDDEL